MGIAFIDSYRFNSVSIPAGSQTMSVVTADGSSTYAVTSTVTSGPIAHEAESMSVLMNTAGTWNTTHPGVSPTGVAVVIISLTTDDKITSVSYGGVPMTRVVDISHSGGTDSARIYVYFLGSITSLETFNSADLGSNSDDPSLTLSPGAGVATAIYYGLFHGWEGSQTVEAGSTQQYTTATMSGTSARFSWARKTGSGGATTIGFTTEFPDDACHAGIAIKDI